MQPIKLIAIDLDGTLLNEKKEISEYSLSVLRRAVEAGVYITVASGRRYSDVMDFSEAIAPGQPVICANGAMACLNDPYECVYCECLPKARLRSVVELLEKEKCYYHVYCDDGSVMESRTANPGLKRKLNCYDYQGEVPTLQDFRAELLKQDEPEAKEIALAIELFTNGSLNTFAKHTNVDTNNRLICYDILDLGKQLMPIGMLVVLDSILNRITQNRAKGRNTFIFIDEIYLLFQHEYSANFLFTLWKRVRKYGAYATGITQNVDDLLQSHTARTMLANSEFIIMLNQASTDRLELAKLLNISDLQMSYITNVEAGHGLIKVGSSLVPFANKFPKNTKLYKLMTTKPGESA